MQNIHRIMKSNLSQTDDYHLNTGMQLNRLWIDAHYIARLPAGGHGLPAPLSPFGSATDVVESTTNIWYFLYAIFIC